jgi:hypothetical protein
MNGRRPTTQREPMMSRCISESSLERHALSASSGGTRALRIRAHLESCPRCREAYDEFAAFYREAAAAPERSVRDGASRLRSRAARVLVLRPMREPPAPQARSYRLAAEGGASQRYETVHRFANADEDVLARVMRDHATGELTLYLVEEKRFGDQVIEIDGIEGRFIPDAEGRVPLPGLNEKALKGRSLRLKSPIASFDLAPFTGLKERIALEGRFEVRSPEFDRIEIEVDEASGRLLYRVRIMKLKERAAGRDVHVEVSRRGEPRFLSKAHRGVAVFENLDIEKVLKIRIF